MKITFPGNKRVDAHINGFTIHTDQRINGGGDGTAPEPFEYFLTSIGTCAGIYIKVFCDSRGLSTDGIEIEENIQYDPIRQRIGKVILDIQVPPEFPEKYRDALIHTANLCAVKKYLQDPFEVETITSEKISEELAISN
jgi:ribosomal protein S12 methylthiotransferase accessory factor